MSIISHYYALETQEVLSAIPINDSPNGPGANMDITFRQLLTLNAVVQHGGFQAGAKHLNKTHPSISTTIKNLEHQLGFSLFCRKSYRPQLTTEGKVFYQRSKKIIQHMNELKLESKALLNGIETKLHIILGDLTPPTKAMQAIQPFSLCNRGTQLDFSIENISGPLEKLYDGKADIIIHHLNKSDPHIQSHDFCSVKLTPVIAASHSLSCDINNMKYGDLMNETQCIIKDTGKNLEKSDYFLLDGAPNLLVDDQETKKSAIVNGLGWGHMPDFLIKNELADGSLISIASPHIKEKFIDIACVRLRKPKYGPMETALWNTLADYGADRDNQRLTSL